MRPECGRPFVPAGGLGLLIYPDHRLGSQLVIKLMERFPLIITLGGMLLGWIAGGMLVPALANPTSGGGCSSAVDGVTGRSDRCREVPGAVWWHTAGFAGGQDHSWLAAPV